jgi:hypothetical protein
LRSAPSPKRLIPEGKPLYALRSEDTDGNHETIEITDNHPFWVEGQGWTGSAKLGPGMQLTDLDGGVLHVIGLQFLGRVEDTYNQTVADYHTCFTFADHGVGAVEVDRGVVDQEWGVGFAIEDDDGRGTQFDDLAVAYAVVADIEVFDRLAALQAAPDRVVAHGVAQRAIYGRPQLEKLEG